MVGDDEDGIIQLASPARRRAPGRAGGFGKFRRAPGACLSFRRGLLCRAAAGLGAHFDASAGLRLRLRVLPCFAAATLIAILQSCAIRVVIDVSSRNNTQKTSAN